MNAVSDLASSLILGIAVLAGTATFIARLPRGEIRNEVINPDPTAEERIVLRFSGQSIFVARRSGPRPAAKLPAHPNDDRLEGASAQDLGIAANQGRASLARILEDR